MACFSRRSACRAKESINEIVCFNASVLLGTWRLVGCTERGLWGLGSDLRASLSGKDVPEDIKARLLALHEENIQYKEQLKTTQDKLLKARTVRPYISAPCPCSQRSSAVHQRAGQAVQGRACEEGCRRTFGAIVFPNLLT